MKVSIIIPVYNCEKYISRCIDSVLNQTYKDYELILINDGSIDHTQIILERYHQQYPNHIIIVNQTNAGASAARNKGISLAKGEYITFIDSDDYIASDFLAVMLENDNNEDLIVSGYKKANQDHKILFTKLPEIQYWSLFKYTTNWANLYKRAFIIDNHIHFNHFRIGEDVDFTMQCILNMKTYKILDYAGYYYFINDESITNTINKNKKVNSIAEALKSMNEYVEKSDYTRYDYVYYYFLKTAVFNLIMQRKHLNATQLKKLYKSDMNVLRNLSCLNRIKKGLLWQKGEELYINMALNIILICEYLHLESVLFFFINKV